MSNLYCLLFNFTFLFCIFRFKKNIDSFPEVSTFGKQIISRKFSMLKEKIHENTFLSENSFSYSVVPHKINIILFFYSL